MCIRVKVFCYGVSYYVSFICLQDLRLPGADEVKQLEKIMEGV